MHHPTDRLTHTTPFVTPVVEHWLEREIAQWVCNIEYMCLKKHVTLEVVVSHVVCVNHQSLKFRYECLGKVCLSSPPAS